MLLTVAESSGTLGDYDTFAAILGSTGNIESTATNYARKTSQSGIVTVDDTNDLTSLDMADQTWTSFGTTAQLAIVGLVTGYEDSTGDSGIVPISFHSFAVSPDGSDVTAQINTSGLCKSS